MLAEHFGLEAGPAWNGRETLTRAWHGGLRPWYWLLPLAPLLCSLVALRRGQRRSGVLLGAVACAALLPAVVLMVTYRFLHPLEPLLAIALPLLGTMLVRWPARRGAPRPDAPRRVP